MTRSRDSGVEVGPALRSTFLRSFLIQGSWNVRTMIGGGFAFALLPVLRRIHEDEDALREALGRHAGHFNAHPYLAGAALGAVARMEQDGSAPEVIDRFKVAVRGPLGGLGDALVWAAWLPTTLLAALVVAWLWGAPVAVVGFLVVYNVGHLVLRVWALRTGYQSGPRLGERLRRAELGHRAEQITRVGCLALGVLAGTLLSSPLAFDGSGLLWKVLGVSGFFVGLGAGFRAWRPAAIVVVAVVFSITLVGGLS